MLPPHARLREELRNLVYEVGAQGIRVIDRGKVHQDHAVAVRGVLASLANQGGGLFLMYKAEYEKMQAAGASSRTSSRVCTPT